MKKFGLAALMVAVISAPVAAAELTRPKLIVAISVDQFSADLFAEYRQTYTSGMKRMANAVVFPSGYQSTSRSCSG